MSSILKKVQYLLEADAANSTFIEVKGDPKIGPSWIMNVKVIGPKEWDYFGTNVKVEGKDVFKNGQLVGTVSKKDSGYVVSLPEGSDTLVNGNQIIAAPTIVEAVFQFLKFYFADV